MARPRSWAGSQFQTVEQATAAAILGVKPEQVAIHTLWAGGSFGRRATPAADYIAELAMIAKVAKRKEPIHLVWTREDDITGGYYRPVTVHRIRAGLDAKGNIAMGIAHRQSVLHVRHALREGDGERRG